MCYSGEPGPLGKIETYRDVILRKIKNRSASSHYDIVGERVESILLMHLSTEGLQKYRRENGWPSMSHNVF